MIKTIFLQWRIKLFAKIPYDMNTGWKSPHLAEPAHVASWVSSPHMNSPLVPCSHIEVQCPPTAIWAGADISEVSGCHLLRQMSSQSGSQKLLQGLMSHELTAYLSIFNQFKLNELWPYYQKHVNQIVLNCTTL